DCRPAISRTCRRAAPSGCSPSSEKTTQGEQMMRTRFIMLPTFVCLVTGGVLLAQGPPEKNPAANNPHLGNAQSIRSGMALFRIGCADCHGLDARGYRGPDLTALLAGDITDERLFQTIRKGVPGTDMPAAREIDTPDNDL